MEKLVKVKNLKVKFHTDSGEVNAVRGISFDINKGVRNFVLWYKNYFKF